MFNYIKSNSFFLATLLLIAVISIKALVVPAILLLIICWLLNDSLRSKWLKFKSNKWIWLFSFVFVCYLFGMSYSDNQSFGWKDIELKISLLLFPIIYGTSAVDLKNKFRILATCYIFSLGIISLISFLYGLFTYNKLPIYGELDLFLHPSYLAMYLNMALVLIAYLIHKTIENKQLRYMWYTFMLFLIFIIFLSLSKSGIIVCVLTIFYFTFQFFIARKKTSLLLIVVFTFFLGAFASYLFLPGFKERFVYMGKAFSPSSIDPQTSESSQLRILIWEQAWEIYTENPILGTGTGDIKDELFLKYKANGITSALEGKLNVHNQFLQVLATLGVVGFFVFFLSLVLSFSNSIQRKNYLFAAFLIIISINFLVESMLEKQDGLLFFAFFNSLLFFHAPGILKNATELK